MVFRSSTAPSPTPGDKALRSARRPLNAPISFDSFDKSIRKAAAGSRAVDCPPKIVRKAAPGSTADEAHNNSARAPATPTPTHHRHHHAYHVGSAPSPAARTRSHERVSGRRKVRCDNTSTSRSDVGEEEVRRCAPPSECRTLSRYDDGTHADGHFVVHHCSTHHRCGHNAGGYRIRTDEYTEQEASYALGRCSDERASTSVGRRQTNRDFQGTVRSGSRGPDTYGEEPQIHRRLHQHHESSPTSSATHPQYEKEHGVWREHKHEHERRHRRKHHRREASGGRAGHGDSGRRRRDQAKSGESSARKHRHASTRPEGGERWPARTSQRDDFKDVAEPARGCSPTAPSSQRRLSPQSQYRVKAEDGARRRRKHVDQDTHTDHHTITHTTPPPATTRQHVQRGAPELAAAVHQFLDVHRRDIAHGAEPSARRETACADVVDRSTIIVIPSPGAHDHTTLAALHHGGASPHRWTLAPNALWTPQYGAEKQPTIERSLHAEVQAREDDAIALHSVGCWNTSDALPAQDTDTGPSRGAQQCFPSKTAEVQVLIAEKAPLSQLTETPEQSQAIEHAELRETSSECDTLRVNSALLQEKHHEFTLEQRRVVQTLRAREEQAQESLRVATAELARRQETLDQLRLEYQALSESRCSSLHDKGSMIHAPSDVIDQVSTDAETHRPNKSMDHAHETRTMREKRALTLEKTLWHVEKERTSDVSRRKQRLHRVHSDHVSSTNAYFGIPCEIEICKKREAELATLARQIEERLQKVEEKEKVLSEREKSIERRALCESAEAAVAQRERDQRHETVLRQHQEALVQRDMQMVEELENAKEQMRTEFAQQKKQYCEEADRTIEDMRATLAALTAKVTEYESRPQMLSRSGDLLLQDLKRREEAVGHILTSIARVLHIAPHRDILMLARDISNWITAGAETSAPSAMAGQEAVRLNFVAHRSPTPSNPDRESRTPALADEGARPPTALWEPPAKQYAASAPHTFIKFSARDASLPTEELRHVATCAADTASLSRIPPSCCITPNAAPHSAVLSCIEAEEAPRPPLWRNEAILSMAHSTQTDSHGGPLYPYASVPPLAPSQQQQASTLRTHVNGHTVRPSQIPGPSVRHAMKKTPRAGSMSARGTPRGTASEGESRCGGAYSAISAVGACWSGAGNSSTVATPGSGRVPQQIEEQKGLGVRASSGRARGSKTRSKAEVCGAEPTGPESESTASTTSTAEGKLEKDVSAQMSSVLCENT